MKSDCIVNEYPQDKLTLDKDTVTDPLAVKHQANFYAKVDH